MWRSVADLFRAAVRRQNIFKPDTRLTNSEECKQVCGSEYIIFPVEKTAEKRKQYVNENHENKKQYNDREEKLKDCRPSWEPSWVGAIGWSSAVVLSWYVSQPVCWRRFLRCRRKFQQGTDRHRCRFLLDAVSRYAISQPLASPRHSLPPVTVASGGEDSPGIPHGPVTAEQAVDEAAEKFAEAQNEILGAVENSKGVQLMEAGEHKKAVAFFKRASAFQNARAAYNLGICYEKGIGTPQSLTQAAQWYELASSRGHAGAMYNLGVFYSRGLGDLAMDRSRAKQLFESAAKLGQPDAARTLDKIKRSARAKHSAEDSKALYKALGVDDEVTELRSLTVSEAMLQALGRIGPQSEMLNVAFQGHKLSGGNHHFRIGGKGFFLSGVAQPMSFCKSEVTEHLQSSVYANCIQA